MTTIAPTPGAPEVKHNQFYLYDQAIFKWLREVRFKGVPVPVVWASPSRAFAKMRELYLENGLPKRQQRREINDRELPDARVFLPFCSVMRSSTDHDFTRYARHRIRTIRWSRRLQEDPERKFVLQAEFPYAVDITYDVEFWCRTVHQMNQFRTWLSMRFRGDEFFLNVPHYWSAYEQILESNFDVPVRFQTLTDNSDLEPGEDRRALRFSLGFLLKGWLMRPLDEVRTVLEVSVEIYKIDYNDFLNENWDAAQLMDTVEYGPPETVPPIAKRSDLYGTEPGLPRRRNQ